MACGMTDSANHDLVTMFLKLTNEIISEYQLHFHLFLTQIYHETYTERNAPIKKDKMSCSLWFIMLQNV